MSIGGGSASPSAAVLLRAAALGAASAMRSATPLAALSRDLAARGDASDSGTIERLLGHPAAPALLAVAALGEVIADKLPIIPARTEPGPLAGRMASGAVCGAVVARRAGESPVAGALVGAAAALAGTFAAYHLRRALTVDGGLPDLPVALAEDAAALTVSRAALRGIG